MIDARVFVTRTSGPHSIGERYHLRKLTVSEQTTLDWSRDGSEVRIPSLHDQLAFKSG
jgi:hypothetical protein